MKPTIALRLRLGEHGPTDAAPDVDAFRRPSRDRTHATETIAMLPGRRPLEPRAPLLVFFQHVEFGIPAPGTDVVPLPDLATWSLCPTVFGHLAAVPRATDDTTRRTAWVLAACLPMTFATQASAAPSREPTAVQRPKAAVPAPPELPDDPFTETAPAPPTDPAPDPDGGMPPADAAPEPPTITPVAPPPVPRDRDPAIVDAAWEGVDGFEVELKLKGGAKMRGRVGAVQRDTFTLIQHTTGAVLVLPKNGVLSLRVRMPPPLPDKTGVGALVGGVVLVSVGTPVFISGVALVAACPSCTYIHLPLLIIGGAALGAGIPLLVRGARNRAKYRRAVQEHAIGAAISRTPQGWSGGLRFRF